MANSVVKVTDAMLNDSLLLLVGEDGTVTPDRETVETYLSSKTGATNIQIMHINKNDGKGIDVSIDNLTYLPDADTEDILVKELNMDEVSRNLYNFKLDHDYTPLTSPRRSPIPEEDELAKTLSILDGGEEVEPKKVTVERTLIPVLTPIKNTAVVSQVVNKIEKKVESKDNKNENISTVEPEVKTPVSTKAQRRSKFISSSKPKPKPKNIEEELEENSEDEDFDIEFEDDENDSDFDMEEEIKPKLKRGKRTKSESSKMLPKSHKETPKQHKPELPKEKPQEKPLEVKPPDTPTDKKPPKKEKKTPKPIPDDFALFSTPDIIRRVGGKEPTTPEASPTKPAKITQESRSKSTSDGSHSPTKHGRVSFDGKLSTSKDIKLKDRRPSSEVKKRTSIDEKPKKIEVKPTELMEVVNSNDHSLQQVPLVIPPEEHQSHIPMEDFGTVVPPVEGDNINLDGTGLELDQSLLDNLNNDLIPEDILYQVAQSLVRNTELQSVIDKGINEGVLNASVQDTMNLDDSVMHNTDESFQESSDISPYKGTQIVRPDGRIVTIPPIERPATRSRNKRSDEERPSLFKPVHKPLDDEHVSGNELDSSGDEEEESEDDPNKLWCICNQPHNNRFMICCDTCEEWYHGKCVNITKAMGQQMESEGKEWICLFCKDPSLRRPQAAARRVRKASRNSRASTDSVDSSKKPDVPGSTGSMPCVVCQKPARKNSIFCSEACILEQAKNVERAVVFDRATGNMLTGNKAPSAANLEQWLKEHPTFEAVKSGGKVVTAKSGNMTQSKLKLVKNTDTEGVSLAIQNKAGVVGVLKHAPKQIVNVKTPTKVSHFKIVSKQVSSTSPAIKTTKLISPISKPTNANVQSVTTTPTTPKVKVIQTTIKTNAKTPQAAKQPVPVKTPKARQQEVQAPQAKKQENIRENVQKTLFEQLTNRLKDVEDIKLSEDEVKSISTEIESQLYRCFGDTGQKYRNKYRSLIFNIKDVKNQTLWRRICEKSINPYELVRLSPDDLASQELAMWREREAKHQLDMIKKSELELLNCNRQYVLKTHKGEQVLEDDRRTDKVDNIEAIKSLTEGSTLSAGEAKQEKDKDTDKKSAKHSHKDKEREREKKLRDHHKKRSSSRDRSRKRSKSRDRKDKKKSRSRDRDRDKHRKSHKSSKHKIEGGPIETSKLDPKSKEILDKLVVNKIVPPLEDRLWRHVPQEDIVPAAESDSDHEPTSTVTIPTPPRSSEQDDEKSSTEKPEKEKPAVEERSMSPPPKKPPAEIWRGYH
ncbi:unnamed protein product [Brassicogethes aeneus]|uniref:Death-inducer obliterator 1 n=1 Tax=Brassicogethes aeneus TaxID=1431903 RepID=A0A9P0B862_BRAAE|nr:unnamed protein product [Brassicogethes aeneus]